MKKSSWILIAVCSCIVTHNSVHAQAPVRRVLIEHFTASWCGYSPYGFLAIEQLQRQFPGQIISASYHLNYGNNAGESLSIPSGEDLYRYGSTGFPSAFIDRINLGGSAKQFAVSDWASNVKGELDRPEIVDLSIPEVQFDTTWRNINFSVQSWFAQDYDGKLGFDLFLLEDSVIAEDQENWLTGLSSTVSPYDTLPRMIAGFPHRTVVRDRISDCIGGYSGLYTNFPEHVTAGQTFTQEFSLSVPPAVNISKASVFVSLHKTDTALLRKAKGVVEVLNSSAPFSIIDARHSTLRLSSLADTIRGVTHTSVPISVTVHHESSDLATVVMEVNQLGDKLPISFGSIPHPQNIGSHDSITLQFELTPLMAGATNIVVKVTELGEEEHVYSHVVHIVSEQPSSIETSKVRCNALTVSPNPFKRSTEIYYEAQNEKEHVVARVFDMLGREVLAPALHTVGTTYAGTLTSDGLSAGCYTIIVSSASENYSTEVIYIP
jgi:hypothetical protein